MKPGYIIGVLVVALLGLGTLVLATQLVPSEQVSDSSESTRPKEVTNKSEQKPVKTKDKAESLKILKGFVPAFYGRSTTLYAGTSEETLGAYRQEVAPYATDAFVSEYVTTLDSGVDQKLEQQAVTVRASLLQNSLVGHFDNTEEAEAEFAVRFVLISDDRIVQTYRANVFVTLVRESGAWQVDTIHEL